MKKNHQECFCALCRSPRVIKVSRELSVMNYLQIFLISALTVYLLFPYLQLKSLLVIPFIWGSFEAVKKLLYRRDLKCELCGFDPTWYKKDVKLARRKVEEHLSLNPEGQLLLKRRQQAQQFLSKN